jgi:formylglycine-generating enzyme required for sulfatase activity
LTVSTRKRSLFKWRKWLWVLALAAIAVTATVVIREQLSRRIRVNSKDRLTYLWIPPGPPFMMGCSPEDDKECGPDEKPAHLVTISGFWMGKTEVTQAAYERVMRVSPGVFKDASVPVDWISWDEAHEYCAEAGLRLPTEAEWEYAARGGTRSARYGPLDSVGWFDGNSGGTPHKVGEKEPNKFGLYDMLGNVWEWVEDGYGDYKSEPINNPQGNLNGYDKVLRGGSWYDDSEKVRVSGRNRLHPKIRNNNIGVRCAGDAFSWSLYF